MEQNPSLSFKSHESLDKEDSVNSAKIFASKNPERLNGRKSFEELVHEALEKELRFEQDPALRDQASQRADEIIAEFQEEKQQPSSTNPLSFPSYSNRTKAIEKPIPAHIAKPKLKHVLPTLPLPSRSRFSSSIGLIDLVMGLVILVLLLIVILLIIFKLF